MTLNEAIKHCLEVAEDNDLAAGTYDLLAENNHNLYEKLTAESNSKRCTEFAGFNRQLAEWLTELKELKAADVQPVKQGKWITKAEEYYKAWQDSGRSWNDMPYFVTGLKFACSNCFEQFDVNAEGVEKWNGCPLCLARMDGDTE
jgi:hypothetical protein